MKAATTPVERFTHTTTPSDRAQAAYAALAATADELVAAVESGELPDQLRARSVACWLQRRAALYGAAAPRCAHGHGGFACAEPALVDGLCGQHAAEGVDDVDLVDDGTGAVALGVAVVAVAWLAAAATWGWLMVAVWRAAARALAAS